MKEVKKPLGIYIHIPFCSRKCDYCDFVSYSMDRKAQEYYLGALCAEIDRVKKKLAGRTFNSIFIGGGTPSVVYEGFISGLSRKLFTSFKFEDKVEFTVEVNPASFTKDKLFEYAEAGVNRISVGVQCLDSKLLANHGRFQTLENVKETFAILKESEFYNVNSDVMLGLPGQSKKSIIKTIKFLIKHNVKHISTYALQIERHTMLYDKVRTGQIRPMADKKQLDAYNTVYKMLKKAGFLRYEVSNFARAGFQCEHNKKYWNGTEYIGLGVSAHSYIDGYRTFNTKRLDVYLDKLYQSKNPTYRREYITNAEKRTERIMLALRMSEGLDLEAFKQEFGEDLLETKAEAIQKLSNLHMITIKDNHLRIAEPFFYVSNSIIIELL